MLKNTSQNKLKNIFVMDSGVGGIPLLKKLCGAIPANYTYFADTKNFPYGEKNVSALKKIARETIEEYYDKADAFVFACNTMSLASLNHVVNLFPNKPIFGCVPPVNPALMFTINNVVVFCTELTAKLLKSKSENVIIKPVQRLVELVETEQNEKKIIEYLEQQICEIEKPFDCIVLGCTHFSVIKTLFYRILPAVKLFDSIDGVVSKMKKTFAKSSRNEIEQSSCKFMLTNEEKISEKTKKYLADFAKFY